MKFNKQLAIILVLLSMLLSAIAVSVYFYNQNQQVVADKNRLVKIFVAKNDIKKGALITNKDIKETTIAREFVLTKPLIKKVIINKYAKEPIYVNEPFLKQKLTTAIAKEKAKTLDFKYNSYNMSYKMFKNPNYILEPNDVIKIVSVTTENNLSVQYVIKNIRVLGFLADGLPSEKAIFKKKIKKVVKKQTIEEIINVRASELILDIKENDMLSLIKDWNKGGQLWMVKSKIEEDSKVDDKEKKKEAIKLVKKIKRTYVKKKVYPIKWYYAKESSRSKTATIFYEDKPEMKKTKSVKISSSFYKECSKKDKLLLVKSNKAYLRTHPSIRSKIHKKVYKNYVIAYTNASKINSDWFMICDGSYIQRKDTKIISYKEYKRLENRIK